MLASLLSAIGVLLVAGISYRIGRAATTWAYTEALGSGEPIEQRRGQRCRLVARTQDGVLERRQAVAESAAEASGEVPHERLRIVTAADQCAAVSAEGHYRRREVRLCQNRSH